MLTSIRAIFNHPGVRRAYVRLRVPLAIVAIVLLFPFLQRIWLLAGFAVSMFGELIQLWSFASLDKNSDLAIRGPYALVRNPMYLGRYFILLGFLMLLGAWWVLVVYTVIYWFYWIPASSVRRRICVRSSVPVMKSTARKSGASFQAHRSRDSRSPTGTGRCSGRTTRSRTWPVRSPSGRVSPSGCCAELVVAAR